MMVILHGSYDHGGEGGCCLLDPCKETLKALALAGLWWTTKEIIKQISLMVISDAALVSNNK